MDSYSFKGFDVKRGDVQTLSILSRGESSTISSSSEESKAETKETKGSSSFNIVLKCLNLDLLHGSFRRYVNQPVDLVVSSEYDRERVSKFLETHRIETRGVRVASTSSARSSVTIWEHPEEFTSKSVMSRLELSSSSSSTDTIRPDAVRCRRTILRSRHFNRHQHVHVFTSTALAKQFATRHVSNRHGVTVLFNMPYAAQFMEQGLTSAFTNANVFTIDGGAISRIFETSLDTVLSETLSLILGEKSSSPSSELTLYIKENGLVTLNIPKSKISSLPLLSKSDESNTFRATPYVLLFSLVFLTSHSHSNTQTQVHTSQPRPTSQETCSYLDEERALDVFGRTQETRSCREKHIEKSLQDSQERSNDLTIVRRNFPCYHTILINAQTLTQVRKRSRTHRTRTHLETRRGVQTRTHSTCQTSQRFQQSRDIFEADEMERRRSRGIW